MLDTTAAPTSIRVKPLRRRKWPLWVYYVANVLASLVIWPLLKTLEWCGVLAPLMAKGFNGGALSVDKFEPESNDVLIASYFKSGTNWTMQTAAQIAHHGRVEFEHIHDLVPWYELPKRQKFTVPMAAEHVRDGADRGLRIIKTHLPMSVLGYGPTGYYVWVIRDPKDVFVSSYHFLRNVAFGHMMMSVEHLFASYLSPDTFSGSWAEHVKGGWEHRDRDNVLFLTFEQMKADPRDCIRQMSELIDVELSTSEFDEVVRRSSFEYMKAHGHQFDTFGISPPWIRPRGKMVRRGQSGSASELLTQEDQRRIDDYWRNELKRIDCDFPYDEHYG